MMSWYHGGFPGLRIGGYVLPPAETGACSTSDLHGAPAELRARAAEVHRKDRVYITTDLSAALLWAGLHPDGTVRRGGDVYRVEPVGELEPDPDYLGDDGASMAVPRALVVGIVRTGVARAPYLHLLGEVS